MKVSELDFLRLLPVFMRDDEAVMALSRAVDELMGNLRLDTLSTWDKIDELNEKECDDLAWELDIDWYEPASLSLVEKRETIKLAQPIKRKRGTKWAVERLISLYLGEGGIIEWCDKETPGIPFTFEVYTSNEDVTEELFEQFKKAVNIAKNERSHMIAMSHRYLLNDIVTGTKYYLFVDGGRLMMERSDATAEPKEFRIYDSANNSIYSLYVENGNLMMNLINQSEQPPIAVVGQARVGQCRVASAANSVASYASRSVASEVTEKEATVRYVYSFRDSSLDTTHELYVENGNLMLRPA